MFTAKAEVELDELRIAKVKVARDELTSTFLPVTITKTTSIAIKKEIWGPINKEYKEFPQLCQSFFFIN